MVQHKFDPEDWLRLVQTYGVTTTFTAPTPIRMVCTLPAEVKDRYDRSSMQAAHRQRRALDAGAEEDVPGGLPARLALGGLRLDRAGRRHRAAARRITCASPGHAVSRRRASRSSCSTTDGGEVTEPFETGELYVRSAGVFDTYYKAEEKYDGGAPGGTSTPSATSPTATRTATTTSPTARTT